MELPSRSKNDRYTQPGEYLQVEERLRRHPTNANIPTLVAYAFDYRTRLGPFLFLDRSLLPAGPRAVAAALHKAGFTRTRIALRQFNPNLQMHQARIDGSIPEMLFVSSMQIHSADAYEMIRDAHLLGERAAVHSRRRRQGDLRTLGLLRPRTRRHPKRRRGLHRRRVRHVGVARPADGVSG